MANWCSNRVEFTGEHSQFVELGNLFTAMAAKEKKEEKGQMPDFVKEDSGYMFQTGWENGILYFETKWGPNPEVMVKIADHFKVGFIHSYSEPSNCVHGEATYKESELNDICLDWSDTDSYQFNEETSLYDFEGQEYESSDDIVDILLERKKKAFSQISLITKSDELQ
jgi:hypothetical protein